jgi:hypothetical protein
MRELEAVRVELRIKSEILDEYRKDVSVKAEEVQNLRKSSEQNIKLKETLSHLNMEKGVLNSRFEQIKRDHEVACENLLRIQSSHAAFESENVILKKEISNLRIKCELVEEIGRENERLKMHNITLKGDNQGISLSSSSSSSSFLLLILILCYKIWQKTWHHSKMRVTNGILQQ